MPDAKKSKKAISPATLTKGQQKRLKKLAKEGNSTPQKILQWVLRDGFEYTEYAQKAIKEALSDKEPPIPHDQVLAKLKLARKERARRNAGKWNFRIVKIKDEISGTVHQIRAAYYNEDGELVAVQAFPIHLSAKKREELEAQAKGVVEGLELPTVDAKRLGLVEFRGMLFTPEEIKRCV